jgi:4-hydroxybenzoate polyprenyltransferase
METAIKAKFFRAWFEKTSSLVALPHTVFALPFVLSSFLVAQRFGAIGDGRAISARFAAMIFNRIIDRSIDQKNPRTLNRDLPAGKVSLKFACIELILFSSLFIFAAFSLGTHCGVLAPLVLGVLFLYSVTKRFTWLCHYVLGLCLALGPGGAWWVLRPEIELVPITLMIGVLFWSSGFDILYSLQDEKVDREQKLFSIPVRFGTNNAMIFSRVHHVLAIVFFFFFVSLAQLSSSMNIILTICALILLTEHILIAKKGISMINHIFFTLNGVLSILFFLGVVLS